MRPTSATTCRFLLTALVLAGTATGSAAQRQQLAFSHLSLREGLSQASVYSVLQDRRGFIWIATQDGLNRYDGYRFQVYKHDAEDPESLGSNTIWALHEDRSGGLWVGTWQGGLHCYDRDADAFTAFRHDPDDPASLSNNSVSAIHEDRAGSLWVGTLGGGLNRFARAATDATAAGRDPGSFTRYLHDPGDPASLGSDRVHVIYEDRAGTLWVGTRGGGLNRFAAATGTFTSYRHDPNDIASIGNDDVLAIEEDARARLWIGTADGGLHRFDRASETFVTHRHVPESPTSLAGNHVYALHQERPGVLWVGTRGAGLNRLDLESGEVVRFRHDPSDPRSLSSDLIASIYQDPSGTLWIGTDGGGVDRLDFKAQKFVHHRHNPEDPDSLGNDSVLSLFEDRAGLLWIGTWGGGLDRFDARTGAFSHFRPDPADPTSLASSVVFALSEDRAGGLWIGTEGAGLQRFDPATGTFASYRPDPEDPYSLSDDDVLTLHHGRDGTLWIGTWEGGLNRLLTADRPAGAAFARYLHDDGDPGSIGGNRIYAIYEDREGVLWVGAEGEGLDALDRQSDRFSHYRHHEDDPASLSNNDVMTIYQDRSGTLWIGTYGGGLNRLDSPEPAGGTFRHYDERHGLPNNVVYGILEDRLGRLWLSTNQGLSRFDPEAESFRNYDVHDGLQAPEFSSGAYHRNRRGVLFFGGDSGFNAFVPEQVEDNPYVPPVVLTSFKKFNEEAALDTAVTEVRAITLGPDDSVVSFEFAALNYTAPQKNRYAYWLEGFNDDWIELGTKRDITFTSLDPGSYVFRVKGSNNDGVWNHEGVAVDLTVVPPYWATWWFRTALVVSLALSVAAVYQIRTRSVRARNQQLESMNLELETVNQQLETKNDELERFSYTVSHDLKSPLVTIMGFAGLVESWAESGDRGRVHHGVTQITTAAHKMARLLDDLLQLCRVGQVVHTPESVSLTELAREAAGLVAGKIEARGVTVEIQPAMPVVVVDRDRLLEVFQNLLDNAVNYMGDQRQPRVEIEAQASGGEVVCRVRDNGIGIEPENHAKVFELFERLNAETEGTGIGLALISRIVKAHDGRIWVESEGRGHGSTFCFALPVREAT